MFKKLLIFPMVVELINSSKHFEYEALSHYSKISGGVRVSCLKISMLLYGRSLVLTAGGSNFIAFKYYKHIDTFRERERGAGCLPLRLLELLSVESSPVLPCMHYLVFFFEL